MISPPDTRASAVVARRPLRLLPGIVIAALLVLVRYVLPAVAPPGAFKDALLDLSVLSGLAGALLIVLWWLLLSRAVWSERLGAIAAMAVALGVTKLILHPSIAGGMMGFMLYIYAAPVLAIALVVWAVLFRSASGGVRLASLVASIFIACAGFGLVRTEGIMGSTAELRWRWSMSPEQRLLAQGVDALPPIAATAPAVKEPVAASAEPAAAVPMPAPGSKPESDAAGPASAVTTPPVIDPEAPRLEWSGFRGPARDSVVRGVQIETDWVKSPPRELWRRAIGPGWSSFAVRSDVLYTQEQRGDDEIVAAYRVSTGAPVWRHSDAVRFYESNGGAGPRATPSLSGGRLYSLGATGIVNALDAGTGAAIWSRHADIDTGATLPGWGFTGSPLVLDGLVVIAASGRLVAYNKDNGEPRWSIQTKGGSYSSPQLATIDGVQQVVMLSSFGATSVSPADGKVLWEHAWDGGTPIIQPAVLTDGDMLVTTADPMGGLGVRRIAVSGGAVGWTVDERWTSRSLKPYFSDYVVHEGHAFGFDGRILSCISLEDGARKWKGGRYGQGQLVLLADQGLLIVVSEEGELALVSATPDGHKELGRIAALNAKTWNHPVVVGDVLLVRNGEEMVAFRLPRLRQP